MPRDKINNKVEENTWTKYVPPTKRRNKSNNKDKDRIKEIMETCVELQVPSKVDVECGKNWGDAGD